MALGTLGSTLNDELNRLANGGTYRDMNAMVDEALAAKQWANRENINPYSTDTVGILNEIAGLGLDKRNWLDFNGVCNYIAGTTGLPAAAALRQVYPTTDLLTSQASYYVDAYAGTNYIPTTASGYLYLPGISGNNATTLDSAALDITGDIDVRCKVALETWFSANTQVLVSKFNATGNQRSYALRVVSSGLLNFTWSTNGAGAGANPIVSSTVALPVVDSQTLWVRATLDVDNGASGNTVTFYTSNDGTNWTQLGDAVVTASTTSIFNSTSNVIVGSRDAGVTELARGKFFRAQILDGIGGTVAFDADFETAMTSQTVASFTESSSNAATITINRTTYNFQLDTINNLGTAGSLLPTTVGSSTAADSNDPKFLDHTGTNYVYLPGVASNFLSVPDETALDITGDIDIRIQAALDDWTPAAISRLVGKYGAVGQRSYLFDINTTGNLRFTWLADGTTANQVVSTVATGITDGTTKWLRVTFDVDNGASGNDVKFFTSDDGTTWTQLGATITTAGIASMFNSTTNLSIGANSDGTTPLTAKVFRTQIFSDITGTTKVLDVDTSVITAGSATSFTAVTGQTVTIGRSTSGRKTVAVTQPTWLFGTDDYMEVNNRYMANGTYLYLPGIASNWASAPDSAALDITGDIDLRCKVALDDWTPSTLSTLIGKYGASGQRSYLLYVNTAGTLGFQSTADGSTAITSTSTIAPTVADGATLWVRATLDVDNGASGNTVTFYTSTDGTNWTQLGDPVVNAGTTSIFNSTALLGVGAYATSGATSPARGKFFRAQVYNGIAGTLAFDANFETSITSLLQADFTESSTNAATVTIGRSGSTYRSAGITAAGYLYPGATNTFTASATSFLDFTASESFTVVAVLRKFATWSTFRGILGKSRNTDDGYYLGNGSADTNAYISIDSGANQATSSLTGGLANGNLTTMTGVVNRSTQTIVVYSGSTQSTTGDTTAVGDMNFPASSFYIGNRGGSAVYADMEFIGAAVFRSVLTTAQIRQISNYFANREVYL